MEVLTEQTTTTVHSPQQIVEVVNVGASENIASDGAGEEEFEEHQQQDS